MHTNRPMEHETWNLASCFKLQDVSLMLNVNAQYPSQSTNQNYEGNSQSYFNFDKAVSVSNLITLITYQFLLLLFACLACLRASLCLRAP